MKREPFLAAVRRHCRKAGIPDFRIDAIGGKGSHLKVHANGRATIVKHGDLSPRYRRLVLDQLGLPPDAV